MKSWIHVFIPDFGLFLVKYLEISIVFSFVVYFFYFKMLTFLK
jgi:hypothetical protein